MGIFYTDRAREMQLAGINYGTESSSGTGGPGDGGPNIDMNRVLLALSAVFAVLGIGIFCSMYGLKPWDTVLPATFELTFGGIVGVLIGENASHR